MDKMENKRIRSFRPATLNLGLESVLSIWYQFKPSATGLFRLNENVYSMFFCFHEKS